MGPYGSSELKKKTPSAIGIGDGSVLLFGKLLELRSNAE